MNLSPTQRAILDMIGDRIESEGMPPSQTEIARAFGFSGVRAAQYHLDALEAAGAIERLPGRARGIRLRVALQAAQHSLPLAEAQAADALRLPVLGQVAAGLPIGADIGSDDYVVLDRVFFSPSPDYLLKVKGDSMRDEHHVVVGSDVGTDR